MAVSRLTRGKQLSEVFTRFYASKPKPDLKLPKVIVQKENKKKLCIHDYDIITNPSDQMFEEFMKGYGKQRFNFKRNDYDIWKDCFRERYKLIFFLLKGTNRIVKTINFVDFPSVLPHEDVVHTNIGFFWIDSEFRGVDSMRMIEYVIKNQLVNKAENSTATCFPQTLNLWNRMHGDTKVAYQLDVSYYKPEEMRIPEEMKFDGIFVKNAKEVPDADILNYDYTVFPYERSKYLLTHLRDSAGFGKVAYDDTGKVVGMGSVLIYPSGECVLTPLYADDVKVAQAIFKSILQEILTDEKRATPLLRFQIRSIDQNKDGFKWVQPFVKVPVTKQVMGYSTYQTTKLKIDYKKVFCNIPYTTCVI